MFENLKALADKWDSEGQDIAAARVREAFTLASDIDTALRSDCPAWSDDQRELAVFIGCAALVR